MVLPDVVPKSRYFLMLCLGFLFYWLVGFGISWGGDAGHFSGALYFLTIGTLAHSSPAQQYINPLRVITRDTSALLMLKTAVIAYLSLFAGLSDYF